MTFAEVSIRRPVFAWMLMLGLIVFGAISASRLGVSQLPDVDFPVLSVTVNWPGAAPEVMESEIADRIEQQVISVEGIREVVSSIRQGRATISIEFDIHRDIDAALQEVQSAISGIRLPLDVDPPTIRKQNPEDQPIIWVGVSSPNRSLRELINFVDLSIRDQFQILPGVGEVVLGGFTDPNLRVWVNRDKLTQYELTILDVRDALQRGHLETAAGVIENADQEINLRVMGEGLTTDQVGDILITTRGGRPIYGAAIRVRDLARVEDGLADVRRISRFNRIPAIGLGIKKQRGANAVAVGDRVREHIQKVAATLPEDMKIGINFDSTVFVKESVAETEFTLVLSAIVTGIVCWIFLGALSPTFNVLLSIPTSIIGSFTVIYFMGFTLNLFTLLGLALAIGIVVDDAIMVLENMERHRAMGKSPVKAARDGANEITFAAVAASVAVIAIFLPIAFMQGIIGKFLLQFGVTITVAVALSLLEAVTLTPMRFSQLTSSSQHRGWFVEFVDRAFGRVASLYRASLALALRARILVLVLAIGVFIGSLALSKSIRKEFLPAQDQSAFIIRIETAVGSSIAHTSAVMTQAEEIISKRKDVLRVFVAVGGFGGGEVNTGIVFVTLLPPNERALPQSAVMAEIRNDLQVLPNAKAFVQDLSTRGFTAQRGFPVELNIRGAAWTDLDRYSKEIVTRLEKTGLVTDVNTDYRLGQPEVRVWPLRDEAGKRGVSVEAISDTVSTAIGGLRLGKFTNDSRRYDVRLRLEESERRSADDILQLQIRNMHGELLPLRDVIRIETVPTLQTITRRNRERSVSVYANVAEGRSQAEALSTAEDIAKEILPAGYRAVIGGGAQTFRESFQSLIFVLWLGIVVAYMVLASQFNSFIHPVTVLLALPFSISGAFMALAATNNSLNLYSMIGIVLLMGIVKKNSILLVEFANVQRHEHKLPLKEALLTAAPIRLRPILMTSFSTVAAAIPPALALGPGSETRIPMSLAVIGGVVVSTVFTLYVVPCAYSLFAWFERKPVSIES